MTTKTNPLLDAADYIQENGWCRNSFFNNKGQVCLAGAVGVVTGALVPMTPKEIESELKTYIVDYGYSAKAAEKEIPRHKWSKSSARLKRYVNALRALGEELDDTIPQRLTQVSNPEHYHWITDEKERQQRVLTAQRNELESVVIERNDGRVLGERADPWSEPTTGKYRTTKAQAIGLLRKAAERY